MKKFRHQANRQQIALLPASIDEYIPQDDIVRYIDAMIDEMDLSAIESKYSIFGRPAYHPQVLVKILLYGKMRGIRSSRELSRASQENLRFIFLSNNEKPDFRTLLLFRKRFHKELGSLLKQTIGIGLKEKIITLDHVCIDGTKLRAFAGRNSFKKPKKLKEDLEKLEEEIAQSITEDIRIDEEEEKRYGNNDKEEKLPKGLEDKKVLIAKIKSALTQYEGIEGEKPKKISTTDPESRYMKSKGILPSYNAQAAVDQSSGMVVGGYATNSVTDNAQLIPMLEEVAEVTGKDPAVISADKGYGENEGLAEVERRGIDGYIARIKDMEGQYSLEDFDYDKRTDAYRCPDGRNLNFIMQTKKHRRYQSADCSGCPLRANCLRFPDRPINRSLNVSIYAEQALRMKKKMETEKGKAMLKVRGATVEPVFGHIKYCKKLRQFLFRGLNMINSMWKLELAAYNLEKLAKRFQKGALTTGFA